MAGRWMSGPRLAYVIRKLEGTVPEVTYDYDAATGKVEKSEPKRVDAGYLMFSPQGHWLRIPTKDLLVKYNLHKKPPIIGDDGPLDPRLHPQDAFENLEAAVVAHVTNVCGPVHIEGFEGSYNLPKRKEDMNYVS